MTFDETNLVLGRGSVFFDRSMGDSSVAEGEMYLGNTPSFQVNRQVKRIASKSSYGGTIHDNESHVTSEEITVAMTTDNITWDNYAHWFSQQSTPDEQVSGSDLLQYDEELTIKKGRYFQLGNQFEAFGTFFLEDLIVTIKGQVNTLQVGTDYIFDNEMGRIYFLPTSPRGHDGRVVICSYFKRKSPTQSITTKPQEVIGSMRYIADNVVGWNINLFFPKVRITPVGVIEMKSDEFQQMRFDVSAMKKTPTQPLMYAYRKGSAPIPITSDTSLITADTTEYRSDAGNYQPNGGN